MAPVTILATAPTVTAMTTVTTVHQQVQSKDRDKGQGRGKIAKRNVKAMLVDQEQHAHRSKADQGQSPTGPVPSAGMTGIFCLIMLMHCFGSQHTSLKVVYGKRRVTGFAITSVFSGAENCLCPPAEAQAIALT